MGIDFWLMFIALAVFVGILAYILVRWNLNLAIEYEDAVEEYHNIKEEIEATKDKECE